MYKFLSKHSTSAAFGLGVVISLIAMIAILSGLSGYNQLAEEERPTTSIFNAGLVGAILLTIVAAIAMIGFGLYQIIIHPKGGIRFLLGIVGIGLVGFLFYQFSTVETSGKVYEQIQQGLLTPAISKIVNGALWVMIVLVGVALLGLILSEIRNLFK
jgi:hypothetical protein